MEVFTLYVGQGSLAVVVGAAEAIVVDTRIPPTDDPHAEFIKAALAKIVQGKRVIGLMLTGFDADHADPRGVAWVLHKYQPDWIMYPKYFKFSGTAGEVFRIIKKADTARASGRRPLSRIAVRLDKMESRVIDDIASEWDIHVYSPHPADMDSSNNCSLVAKFVPRSSGFRYLVTGDTENERWETINRIFGSKLRAEVMAAPHHGSRHSAHPETLRHVRPDTILISAGAGNQFGHPHPEAMTIYDGAANVFSTHSGQSLRTSYHWFWGFRTEPWITNN